MSTSSPVNSVEQTEGQNNRYLSISPQQATVFLIVTHVAGVIGLLSPARPLFQLVTPFHLLLTLSLLLYFHHDWRPPFWLFVGGVMLIGYWIEVLGVHTTLIFGSYAYDTTLGVKVLEVPLMIAVNWLLLTYLCGSVVHRLSANRWQKILMAASLMVALDYLIEPVAIAYDFWHWSSPQPPLHNYVGWLFTALVVQGLFHLLSFKKNNALALYLLIIQALFFVALQL